MWGSLPACKDDWDIVVPKDLGDLVIVSAVKTERPELLYPSPDPEIDLDFEITSKYTRMEDNVIESIQLIQYGRRVNELIDIIEESQENLSFENIEPCPPFPEFPEKKYQPPIFSEPELLLVKNEEEEGEEEETCSFSLEAQRLPPRLVQRILEKTVAALLAHAGFDFSMDSALKVFADVADEFLKKVTMLLRTYVDQDNSCERDVYPDAVERLFIEIGFGSVLCLRKFYQTQVLDYREEAYNESKKLAEQYQKRYALIQANFQTKELPPYTKYEKDDDTDIPKINFLAVGDADDIDELQPSLQPGFQMLETFEQLPTNISYQN
ncbi:STAGA complex 65 subunit gamma [Nilaparvata lugens]|uniref:STAGA complex 65 subunit gamma n=1 Tax=Nilaparvata lugens TaxID=108931 RepID=UPI000B9870CA|nr:STAGA complex 65 subunit gamma [Nilaparvata lugens]XP_022193876.1 STAGA complex 65 subunit gamma [Nilaparvata lugens]